MTSRENETNNPSFHRLPKEIERQKLNFVSREREQQIRDHLNLRAASKSKFLIFYVHIPLHKIKKKRMK